MHCLVIKTTQGKTYANIDIGPLNPIFRFKIVALALNWVFQGLLYADRTERLFRILIDSVLTLVLFILLDQISLIYLFVSFSISHTFNWIFNGQIFALLKSFDIIYNDPINILNYAEDIRIRASQEGSIDTVLVYGSLSRNEMKLTSDLDLRIIRKKGFINGLRACVFAFSERSRAFKNKFPLDLYVIDSTDNLLKLRSDEKPIILFKSNTFRDDSLKEDYVRNGP